MPSLPTSVSKFIARCGFDVPKLSFSFWMACTSFLALVLAWGLGLDHPQWAAITVFVTVQPSRGQTIEKNYYRLVGTVIGSVVGLLVLLGSQGNVYLLTAGLALWSGICLFFGTLQRVYRSYGTVLAGYSAIIVAMNNVGPAEMVTWVAIDRVAAIFIGILGGLALGYLIAPKINRKEYEQRTRRILAEMLTQTAQNLSQAPQNRGPQDYPVLIAAAQLCSQLNTLSSQRSGASHLTGPLQDVVICATSLLLSSARCAPHPDLAAQLQDIGAELHSQSDYSGIQRRLNRAAPLCHDAKLEETLLTLSLALPDELGADRGINLTPNENAHWQYDWRTATQAALRITIVTGGIGLLWAITEMSAIQTALISSAIVISLASSGVSPARAMRDTVIGQIIAAISALVCELILWRQGLGGFGQVVAMIPSLLVYALLRGHNKLTLSATDYAISLLVLLTPGAIPMIEADMAIAKAIMAVSGGVIGYFAFRYLFTINPTMRRKKLWRMIKTELQAIAANQPSNRGSASTWRLRFIARLLRILDWTVYETKGESAALTMRKAILTLAIADLIFALGKIQRLVELPDSLRRATSASLRRLAHSDRESSQLTQNLRILDQKIVKQTSPLPGPELQNLHLLCQEVLTQLDTLSQMRGNKQSA